MELIISVIIFIVLGIASIIDVRIREVPDWLSYGLIFAGFGLRLLYDAQSLTVTYVIAGIFGFLAMVLLGHVMYYAGQWGGGDAKLLMGMGAMIGLDLQNFTLPLFLVNLIFAGALYGLAWTFFLSIRHRNVFVPKFGVFLGRYQLWRNLLVLLAVILVSASFFTAMQIPLVSLAALLIMSYYLYVYAKAVEESVMKKMYPVAKLTEGDWIVDDVICGKKRICGPKDLGITQEQIGLLKKHGVTEVLVKEGIPFVPSFLIAFVMTWIMGNWFFF